MTPEEEARMAALERRVEELERLVAPLRSIRTADGRDALYSERGVVLPVDANPSANPASPIT